MLILTIRTDKPEAELGLFEDDNQLTYISWLAGRELSTTIHYKLNEMLESLGREFSQVEGVVCFKGPGSFTGLRIGMSVANALAYSLEVPIVSSIGSDWLKKGILALKNSKNEKVALPEYGAEVQITLPKK